MRGGNICHARFVIRVSAILAVLPAMLFFEGCATCYQSPTLNQDWVPVSFVEPAEGRTDFSLGAMAEVSDLLHLGGYNLRFQYGGKAGLEASLGGAFTTTLGWNAGGVLSGFLIDTILEGQDFLSYGGSAQASVSLVIGKGKPIWFTIGPDIIYSLERGPYFEKRQELAASSTESDTIVNLSPGGNTMTYQWNMRCVYKVEDIGYLGFGMATGIFDPDFPNFPLPGVTPAYTNYFFFDFQSAVYRIFAAMCIGSSIAVDTGFMIEAELYLIDRSGRP